MKLDIILIEPQTPGNIGAIARAMKNFGFENLVLINPKCDYNDFDARARAKHAKEILKKAKIKDNKQLSKYDYLIGTTARLGGDNNIPRSPINPEEFAVMISKLEGKVKIGLVFGRESDGLLNEEIAKCDFIVTIPTNPDYSTMNISHSAAIIFYELQKSLQKPKIGEAIKPINKEQKEVLLKLIDETLNNIHFQTDRKRETQRIAWKRVIGKAMLTRREAQALMGLFRKVK